MSKDSPTYIVEIPLKITVSVDAGGPQEAILEAQRVAGRYVEASENLAAADYLDDATSATQFSLEMVAGAEAIIGD